MTDHPRFAHADHLNALSVLMERFVGYVAWVVRRLTAGRFKGLSAQGAERHDLWRDQRGEAIEIAFSESVAGTALWLLR